MSERLFTPKIIGPYTLRNRVVMAPLTRCRSREPGQIPDRRMALYYAQRASAGLIVTEATQILPEGRGYPGTPGIHSPAQVAGWRLIAEAVHDARGLLFMQLWHVGRLSHALYHPLGEPPKAPSAIAPRTGQVRVIDPEGQILSVPYQRPKALDRDDIRRLVAAYAEASRLAMAAGMDGVEIHAANGYLIDQFLCSGTNHRQDGYGGSALHRLRFLEEVTEAVVKIWGASRVGVRISPLGRFNDMDEADPVTLFAGLAERLNAWDLAYLHVVDPRFGGHEAALPEDPRAGVIMATLRQTFKGPIILCGGYDRHRAEAALQAGDGDLIAFGRAYIANPDLVERFREQAPLNPADPSTFYGGDERGYVDYPSRRQELGLEDPTDGSAWQDPETPPK